MDLGSRLTRKPSSASAGFVVPPRTQALTFGLLQKSGDAVGVHLGLPELHQWQEEGLQCGVEGLKQGETQAEAFEGDVCDRARRSGVAKKCGGGETNGNDPPRRRRKSPARTQEAGDLGVSCVSRVQVHLVGVQPCGGDGQMTAEPVDVPDQGDVHLQGPLAAGFLGVPGIEAGAPGGKRRGSQRKKSPTNTHTRTWASVSNSCEFPYLSKWRS